MYITIRHWHLSIPVTQQWLFGCLYVGVGLVLCQQEQFLHRPLEIPLEGELLGAAERRDNSNRLYQEKNTLSAVSSTSNNITLRAVDLMGKITFVQYRTSDCGGRGPTEQDFWWSFSVCGFFFLLSGFLKGCLKWVWTDWSMFFMAMARLGLLSNCVPTTVAVLLIVLTAVGEKTETKFHHSIF